MNGTDANSKFIIFYTLSGLEMAMHLVGLPLSLINFLLIGRTSLIHPNLKFILLYQCTWIFLRGIARLIICVLKFARSDPIGSEQLQPMKFLYQFSAYNRNFIPHLLIIERIVATLMAKSYERKRNRPITVCWSTVTFLVSLYDSLSTSPTNTSIFGLITTFALLILGVVEFLLFVWLWHYNEARYKRSLKKKLHNLSERYQLSENIRIGKQLCPTVVLQLLNVVVTSVYLASTNFHLNFEPNIASLITVLLTTLFGFLIEVTTIRCHPFLWRDFRQILKSVHNSLRFRIVRIGDSSQNNAQQSADGIAMRDLINGEILTRRSPQIDHIAMLKESWEKGLMQINK